MRVRVVTPRWARHAGIALVLAALGCPPTTSLDTASDATASDAATSDAATSDAAASDTTASDTTASAEPDEPATCREGCTHVASPTWIYEGPEGTHAVVEMVRDADGSLWLGTEQVGGSVALVRLSADGQWLWSAAPGLVCERCELADIALHPSGDVIVSATARGSVTPDQAVIARYDVAAGVVAWVRTLDLLPGLATQARVGELAVLDPDRIVALRVDGYEEGELIELIDLTGEGELRVLPYLGAQQGSGSAWPPLVERAPTGEAVLAHAWWDPPTQRMLAATTRLVPPYFGVASRVLLPLWLDDLAIDDAGRRLELARSRGTDSITLRVTSRSGSDQERWASSLPLLSTSSTRAALAAGPDGSAYVAARTTPRAPAGTPASVLIALARWSSEGTLRWHTSYPLEALASSDPVELVIDDEHGVIVGTVTGGRPTVVRFEQACSCE